MAHLVEHPTSGRVVISQFVGSSPMSGSVLTAQSPEPDSDSVPPSLSAPTPLILGLSLSQKINIQKKFFNYINIFKNSFIEVQLTYHVISPF